MAANGIPAAPSLGEWGGGTPGGIDAARRGEHSWAEREQSVRSFRLDPALVLAAAIPSARPHPSPVCGVWWRNPTGTARAGDDHARPWWVEANALMATEEALREFPGPPITGRSIVVCRSRGRLPLERCLLRRCSTEHRAMDGAANLRRSDRRRDAGARALGPGRIITCWSCNAAGYAGA